MAMRIGLFGTLKYESFSLASTCSSVKSRFKIYCLKGTPSGPKQASATKNKESVKKIILFSSKCDTVVC